LPFEFQFYSVEPNQANSKNSVPKQIFGGITFLKSRRIKPPIPKAGSGKAAKATFPDNFSRSKDR
jgi:hypothetical protein